MGKAAIGIIGSGNIGSDLLAKAMRSEHVYCGIFAGRRPDSAGLARAREMGVETTSESVRYIEENPDCCEVVLDATSALAHQENVDVLRRLGKPIIDLTPSKGGWMCIPAINLHECIDKKEVNLITCGGQASIPIAHEIMKAIPEVEYIEVATSVSSKSAGPGTRINLDEYLQATRRGIIEFSGVGNSKAIININPAHPPINMHNTIYAETNGEGEGKLEGIRKGVEEMVRKIQGYVPGYKLEVRPVYDGGRITTIVEVVGMGDYLPTYAGNLDIMTCAAIAVAEEYAKNGKR
jgi:acetaldehyde dehydrogenase (acetylating)